MKKKSVRLLRAQAERRAELLDLKGPIVYYVSEGGVGFQKSVVFQNFTSPHPPKKIITYENCTPLGNKMKNAPPPPINPF